MMSLSSLQVPTRERLERAQLRLLSKGVEDFKVFQAEGPFTLQQRAEDIADALEMYLDGRVHRLPSVPDAQEPKSDFYKEARALIVKTKQTLRDAQNAHRLTTEELLCLTRGHARDLPCAASPSLPELTSGAVAI